MANPEHVKILKQGVTVWNRWRDDNPAVIPDLRNIVINHLNLPGINLSESNLQGANCYRTNLERANLYHADLYSTDLGDVNFQYADLSWAHICNANVENACFIDAKLHSTEIIASFLDDADLSRAKLGQTKFGDVDISRVIGLEDIEHNSRSIIGINTIFISKGDIPLKFLRGAGLPEIFIDFIISLTRKDFEYPSCFISYSSKDSNFTERLYTDLQNKGVRCWFAPEDIKGGKKIHTQLDEAIKLHEKLLLVISENSMNSDWVANEIKRARKREKESGRQKLFPIRLVDFDLLREWELFDSDTATDLAAEVRSYFIPDFTQWKDHDAYQKAFDRLMRDLKTDDPTGTD